VKHVMNPPSDKRFHLRCDTINGSYDRENGEIRRFKLWRKRIHNMKVVVGESYYYDSALISRLFHTIMIYLDLIWIQVLS